jgi:putative pyruvate formate lyase activating enzyme
MDLWLPDFKFWRDECAKRLMWVGAKASYPEVVKRNHVFAAEHGSMIIRHLVMPGHIECCTKPILDFISETIGDKVLVNIMAQYYPSNMVPRNPEKYPDIARYPSKKEIQEAYDYARTLGLQFEQVS